MANDFKKLSHEFSLVTKDLTLKDWKEIRNEYYWKSDSIKDEYERLSYKIRVIKQWLNNNNR